MDLCVATNHRRFFEKDCSAQFWHSEQVSHKGSKFRKCARYLSNFPCMLIFLFFTTYYVCYMRIFCFKPSKMRSSENIPIIHTWLWGLGNKTKEIILSLSNEQCITYVHSPKPWNQVRLLSYRNWPHLHELVDNHFHQTLRNYTRF